MISLKFTVPFDEGDRENIVFFGNYFRLAHRALEGFLPRIGIPWKDWFTHSDWGMPLRHADAEYMKPLRPGDEFEIRISVLSLGESSVQFQHEFVLLDEVSARLKTTHVCVRRPDMKKTPLPNAWRSLLSPHQI